MDISRAGGVDVNVIISIIESANSASWGRFAICYNLPETQAFPVFSGPNELTRLGSRKTFHFDNTETVVSFLPCHSE